MRLIIYILASVLVGSIIAIAFGPDRTEFMWHFGFYTLAFISFLALCRYALGRVSWSFLFILAIILRLICVFSFPKHSDDIYRFIWDGSLALENLNPYGALPVSVDPDLFKDQEILLEKMNSPRYYSVYPWVHQAVFYVSVLFGSSIYWSAVIIKLALVLFDVLLMLALLTLFERLNIERGRLLLYFLNPLIIIEIALNAHFEGLALLAIILSLFWLIKKHFIKSSMLFFISVCAKLNPLILLPIILIQLRSLKNIFQFMLPFALMLSLYVFLLGKRSLINMGESIMLYFNRFEFNASAYYIMRLVGEAWYGYNPIAIWGPILTIFTAFLILLIGYIYQKKKSGSIFTYALFTYAVYLTFAQVVHPWYIIPLIGLSLFTRWRFATVWSFVVFLSYYTYRDSYYLESTFVLIMEYILLWSFFVVECQIMSSSKKSENVLL